MKHFLIHASKDNTTEIDIFGQIGDSFFEEGNTLDSVKAQIEPEDDLIVNVASLGGSAFEGLAIHDLIKAHKGKTTTNILGTTASAGALVAVASDEVNITENSLFLPHFARGLAMGTAKDLEDTAEDIRKVDNRMVDIFMKKTGKTESKIRNKLGEDKFMEAKEAREFGFVDKVMKPKKIAASIDMDIIMASKELTEIQKNQIKSLTEKPKTMDLTGITDQLKELKDTIVSFVSSKSEKETVEVKILDDKEVTEKLDGFAASLKSITDENDTIEKSLKDITSEKELLTKEITALKDTLKSDKDKWEANEKDFEAEIDRLKGTQIQAPGSEDTEPEEDVTSEIGAFGRMLKDRVKKNLRM